MTKNTIAVSFSDTEIEWIDSQRGTLSREDFLCGLIEQHMHQKIDAELQK